MVFADYAKIDNFMKIDAKINPKNEAKIDGWAIRGPTFETLGEFLRSLIFDEFSIGRKSAKNLIFLLRGAAKCISRRFRGRVGG